MKLTPRAKLLLIVACFLAPIVASVATYAFLHPQPTANYGELLLPPASVTAHALTRADGTPFRFSELRDHWALVISGPGDCAGPCAEKAHLVRQTRLALGRDAARISRVFVVDDGHAPQGPAFEAAPDLVVAAPAAGMSLAPGAGSDREHIYLVDPRGNVMMRWPAGADFRRMLKDLQTLLRASQIG